MVHALDEVRRALKTDGVLIDLRPLLDRWPVEVVWQTGQEQVGRATDLSEPLSDDVAANSAMREWVESGRLVRERSELFSIFYYWDTPKEMQEYLEEEWGDVIQLDEGIWKGLRSTWATANAEARVRIRVRMLITRYRLDRAALPERG